MTAWRQVYSFCSHGLGWGAVEMEKSELSQSIYVSIYLLELTELAEGLNVRYAVGSVSLGSEEGSELRYKSGSC